MTERPSSRVSPDDTRLDACLNGLSGESSPNTAADTERFGLLVRELALAEEQAVTSNEAQIEDALIDRWRAQGLLDGLASGTASRPHPWHEQLRRWLLAWRWWRLALPSGALAFLAVLLWPPVEQHSPTGTPPGDDVGAMRGEEQPQRLVAAEPAALASRLEDALTSNGLLHRRVNLPSGNIQIQSLVPHGNVAAKSALEAIGVVVPPHGRVDVLIVKGP